MFKFNFILSVLYILLYDFVNHSAAFNKYNVTLSQLGTCKEYDIKGTGYVYKDFFYIRTLNNTRTKTNEKLHLKFYVMTNMDAHILLTNTDSPRLTSKVYEIGKF